MEVKAVAYQTIAILHASGPVTVADVETFKNDLAQQCNDFAKVILHLGDAKLDDATVAKLVELRDATQGKQPRLFLVCPKIAPFDADDLPSALDLMRGAETDRIMKLFEKGSELSEVRDQLAIVSAKAGEVLGLPKDAPVENFDLAVGRVVEENRKLKYLLRTLSNEIDLLKKQRARAGAASKIDPEIQARVDQARKGAISIIKSEKILE